VAEGVTRALEAIVTNYSFFALRKQVPYLPDHGVLQNVLGRVCGEKFAEFYEHAKKAAEIARAALDANDKDKSIEKWCELFGSKFPDSDDNGKNGDGSKGPFVASTSGNRTGDSTPRRYG
jgi:hypothetical protein